jgi:hypothetical protein
MRPSVTITYAFNAVVGAEAGPAQDARPFGDDVLRGGRGHTGARSTGCRNRWVRAHPSPHTQPKPRVVDKGVAHTCTAPRAH